jgi:diguanylate cyclase (GGDEF)-like protein/PAS domain S-box-containing protein
MDGRIVEVNQAFTLITGYSRAEVLGQSPRMLSSGRHESQFYDNMWSELSESGNWVGENWNRRKNGDFYVQLQKISTTYDEHGNAQYYVSLFSDITAAKNNEQKLEHLARYDSLTQLPNRALLSEHINQALKQTQRRGQHLAVVFIDLDGFKSVNDNHGHDAGDHLLITLAERMKGTLRTGDMLARLGGDEFVAVLLDLADADASAPMLNRLLGAASQPVEYAQTLLQVSASMGVSFYPQAGEIGIEQLLRQADQAMYQAKQAGKNRFHVFDTEQDLRVRSHYDSLKEIKRALRAGEFVLEYQPKVNLRSRVVVGVEALIRWQHPQRGLLLPAEFLPLVEDHPLAIELGQWVIENALLQIERWRQHGANIDVSINIGRRHLRQPGFVQHLRDTLAEHPQLMPACLEIEILEGCATDDPTQVVQVVKELRTIGIDCTLDKFGSGQGSLTALKLMPLKYLKFDPNFIRDMLANSDSLLILIAALRMASAYEMKVIAAGMETAEHGFMLMELGCEFAQGYGIAPPMPAAELPDWIRHWKPVPEWLDVTLVPA